MSSLHEYALLLLSQLPMENWDGPTGGAVTERQLLKRLGEWSNPERLAEELNRIQGTDTWIGGYFRTEEHALSTAKSGPMGAILQVPYAKGHSVMIEPLRQGVFLVRDPIPGATYEVTEAWVKKYVAGGVYR